MEYSDAKKKCLIQGLKQRIRSRESMLLLLIGLNPKKASIVKKEIEELREQIIEIGG